MSALYAAAPPPRSAESPFACALCGEESVASVGALHTSEPRPLSLCLVCSGKRHTADWVSPPRVLCSFLGIRYRAPGITLVYRGSVYTGWKGEWYVTGEPKPVLRGVLHLLAATIFMPLVALFTATAAITGDFAVLSSIVVVGVVTLMLLVSGTYHRVRWSTVATHDAARRVDHACIFLFGGAAVTAQGLLLMQTDGYRDWGTALLVCEWVCAVFGVVYSLTCTLKDHIDAMRLLLYAASGFVPFAFLGVLHAVLTPVEFAVQILMLTTSMWSILIFRFQLFNVWPDVFGSHEFFHVLVVAGTTLTCGMNYLLVQRMH
jgi:hemolysin III